MPPGIPESPNQSNQHTNREGNAKIVCYAPSYSMINLNYKVASRALILMIRKELQANFQTVPDYKSVSLSGSECPFIFSFRSFALIESGILFSSLTSL